MNVSVINRMICFYLESPCRAHCSLHFAQFECDEEHIIYLHMAMPPKLQLLSLSHSLSFSCAITFHSLHAQTLGICGPQQYTTTTFSVGIRNTAFCLCRKWKFSPWDRIDSSTFITIHNSFTWRKCIGRFCHVTLLRTHSSISVFIFPLIVYALQFSRLTTHDTPRRKQKKREKSVSLLLRTATEHKANRFSCDSYSLSVAQFSISHATRTVSLDCQCFPNTMEINWDFGSVFSNWKLGMGECGNVLMTTDWETESAPKHTFCVDFYVCTTDNSRIHLFLLCSRYGAQTHANWRLARAQHHSSNVRFDISAAVPPLAKWHGRLSDSNHRRRDMSFWKKMQLLFGLIADVGGSCVSFLSEFVDEDSGNVRDCRRDQSSVERLWSMEKNWTVERWYAMMLSSRSSAFQSGVRIER